MPPESYRAGMGKDVNPSVEPRFAPKWQGAVPGIDLHRAMRATTLSRFVRLHSSTVKFAVPHHCGIWQSVSGQFHRPTDKVTLHDLTDVNGTEHFIVVLSTLRRQTI